MFTGGRSCLKYGSERRPITANTIGTYCTMGRPWGVVDEAAMGAVHHSLPCSEQRTQAAIPLTKIVVASWDSRMRQREKTVVPRWMTGASSP
jgi:hypothetical protein